MCSVVSKERNQGRKDKDKDERPGKNLKRCHVRPTPFYDDRIKHRSKDPEAARLHRCR